MSRPKSDLASLASFGVGLYGTKKVRDLENAFRHQSLIQQENHSELMRGLGTISELQYASLHMIRDVDQKLSTLNDITLDISNHLRQKAHDDDFVANQKMLVRSIKKALDEIDNVAEYNYLEYALLQVGIIKDLAENRNLTIEQFKGLSMADLDWVENVLERLESTPHKYHQRLASFENYRLLEATMLHANNIQTVELPNLESKTDVMLSDYIKDEWELERLKDELDSFAKSYNQPMTVDIYNKKKQELLDSKSPKRLREGVFFECAVTFSIVYTILVLIVYFAYEGIWAWFMAVMSFGGAHLAAGFMKEKLIESRRIPLERQEKRNLEISNEITKLDERYMQRNASQIRRRQSDIISEIDARGKNVKLKKMTLENMKSELSFLKDKQSSLMTGISDMIPQVYQP